MFRMLFPLELYLAQFFPPFFKGSALTHAQREGRHERQLLPASGHITQREKHPSDTLSSSPPSLPTVQPC